MERCEKQNRIEEKVTNKRRNQWPDHQEENCREKAFPVTSDAFFAMAETELKISFSAFSYKQNNHKPPKF